MGTIYFWSRISIIYDWIILYIFFLIQLWIEFCESNPWKLKCKIIHMRLHKDCHRFKHKDKIMNRKYLAKILFMIYKRNEQVSLLRLMMISDVVESNIDFFLYIFFLFTFSDT